VRVLAHALRTDQDEVSWRTQRILGRPRSLATDPTTTTRRIESRLQGGAQKRGAEDE
jgi:hypothetical protein